jgi:hypothetical protein
VKASLSIELIGDDTTQFMRLRQKELDRAFGRGAGKWLIGAFPSRAWCAEIMGRDTHYGLARRFLPRKKDYRTSNRVGSRGVIAYYVLESGHVYEVSAPLSWHRIDRYFCRVTDDGVIVRLSQEEFDTWLMSKDGASPSASMF